MADGEVWYDITHQNHPREERGGGNGGEMAEWEEIDRSDGLRKGGQIVKIGELKVVR